MSRWRRRNGILLAIERVRKENELVRADEAPASRIAPPIENALKRDAIPLRGTLKYLAASPAVSACGNARGGRVGNRVPREAGSKIAKIDLAVGRRRGKLR